MASTENGKAILLAEEEYPVRTFALAMLQKADHNVIIVVDRQDGLAKSKEFKGRIHLLLPDMEMRHMTGIELATQFRLTAPMSGMVSGMLLLNEGWRFLSRPFMANLLKERVRPLEQSANAEPGDATGVWTVQPRQTGRRRRSYLRYPQVG